MTPNARLLFRESDIKEIVRHLAERIADYPEKPDTLIPIMNGAFLFGADLLCALLDAGLDLQVYPLRFKRGKNGKPELVWSWGKDRRIAGQTALVVDTICDSGITARRAIAHCRIQQNAKLVLYAALLCRDPTRLPAENFVGRFLDTPDYLFGYGLDRNERYRGLTSIWAEPCGDAVPESRLGRQDQG